MPPRKKNQMADAGSRPATTDKTFAAKRKIDADAEETKPEKLKSDPEDVDDDVETLPEEPPKKKARRSNDGLLSHVKMRAACRKL
jgi:hypothetical protein